MPHSLSVRLLLKQKSQKCWLVAPVRFLLTAGTVCERYSSLSSIIGVAGLIRTNFVVILNDGKPVQGCKLMLPSVDDVWPAEVMISSAQDITPLIIQHSEALLSLPMNCYDPSSTISIEFVPHVKHLLVVCCNLICCQTSLSFPGSPTLSEQE